MIVDTSFRIPRQSQAQSHDTPNRLLGESPRSPAASRAGIPRSTPESPRSEMPRSQTAEAAFSLKAALALATSENKTLQATLEEERRFSTELRLALEKLQHAAITDPLTGLYNRRAMDQQMDGLLCERDSAPLSVLMLDIDHLKHINDTYGHASGDTVIRGVAETLRRCLRAEDSAFRYGGEEFMVLLPNTSMKGAVHVAESIRNRVETMRPILHQNAGPIPCTVSLGVASSNDKDDRDSLFQRADRALYQAKHLGRNRVVHAVA